ncbi:MAG: hypothetical protein K9I29_03370 [Bacteroidales bacterium]|nr:hypothetical protein [Bacteroidales bacterium]MCF8327311.1 hypothetical protein [Bacteroidales bacterium]
MTTEKISKIIRYILVISVIALIIGSYLQLNNVKGSDIITILAVIFGAGALITENAMLKMIIRQKEEKEEEKEKNKE